MDFNRDMEVSAISKLHLDGFISAEKASIDIIKCYKNEEMINKWIMENKNKCSKGHSYRPDFTRTEQKITEHEIILTRKWTCIVCGKHREQTT